MVGDEEVLLNSSLTNPNMTVSFSKPFSSALVYYRYKIGLISIDSENASVIVRNVQPEAGIEKPKDGSNHESDSKISFIAWGRDTPSDNGTLWYIWDFDDGTTGQGSTVTHSFKEPGEYSITLTVEDDHGANVVVTHNLTIESEPPVLFSPIVIFAVGIIIIFSVVMVGFTEPGKYWLGLLSVPLYVKSKDVLDNKTRYALHGVITEKPGIHYSALREEFGLANGQAAYHLSVLEREDFIKSVRDGNMKRFYASTVKVPRSEFLSPEQMREEMVRIISERPGISQRELIEEIGHSRDSVGYHLREMVKDGTIRDAREGKFTTYYPKRVGRRKYKDQ
jgi:predicted transcriptional regulator